MILCASGSSAETLVFQDEEFTNGDWQLTTIAHPHLGSSYSVSAAQIAGGGNTGAFRWVYIYAEGTPGRPVMTIHRKAGAVVDPAAVGGIGTIGYSEDARLDAEALVLQYTGPALIQEDASGVERMFVAGAREASQTTWTRQAYSHLFENHFKLVQTGASAGYVDSTVHPDFSPTGKPISLGFYRLVWSSSATVSFPAAIDNWRIDVHTGAAPNRAPVAKPPDELSSLCCQTITLDGNESYDPDSGPSPLSYSWEQVSGPTVELIPQGADANFKPITTTNDSETYVFKLTVSDGEASNSAQTTVKVASEECRQYCPHWFDCPIILMGCRIGCISGVEDAAFSAKATNSSSLRRNSEFVRTYRGVRDKILGSSTEGQRYTRLFKTHGPEIVELLSTDPVLMAKAQSALQSVQPAFDVLLKTPHSSTVVTAEQIEKISSLLEALSAAASPALIDAINTERTRWGPLENYVGRSTTQVQEALLGYGVFVPRLSTNTSSRK
jgi:hypothetical protein